MHYICPYCNRDQIAQNGQTHRELYRFFLDGNAEGTIGLLASATTCASKLCARTKISVSLEAMKKVDGQLRTFPGGSLEKWNLRPSSSAKPLPEYIPQAIIEDYKEACLIRDLSPKASATLIRRCLQGMIRDFCGIAKPRLIDEIQELRKQMDSGSAPAGVSIESVDAIDRIRGIGNIGAHMEKDVTIIIPVESDEAKLLIELTELLFEEWYIARQKRLDRFAALEALAEAKKDIKKEKQAQLPPPANAFD